MRLNIKRLFVWITILGVLGMLLVQTVKEQTTETDTAEREQIRMPLPKTQPLKDAPKESPKSPQEPLKEALKEPLQEAPNKPIQEDLKEPPKEPPKEYPKEAPKEPPKESPKPPKHSKKSLQDSPKKSPKKPPKDIEEVKFGAELQVKKDAAHDVTESDIKALFPHGDEENDRVLEQLQLKLPVTRNFTILVYNGEKYTGNRRFVLDDCAMQNCYVTRDHKDIDTADAVIFKGALPTLTIDNFRYKPDQVRILYQLESPHHSSGYNKLGNVVNWTATYRRDSVLNAPYERFTPYPDSVLPEKPSRNYALGKTKLVAWFVSHCQTPNGRQKYVKELQKHIAVDIYGACGPLSCPRSDSKLCYDYLNKDYKFYLSFENSNCKDYITEKFFVNGLGNDVLPVVMGAHPEDYRRSAPPHSYIHVDDFASPADLAAYLLKLDADDDLYNDYFRWKGTGEFINTKFWCRLCGMVNTIPRHRMWYAPVSKWWGPGEVCRKPGADDSLPWSTWRNVSRPLRFLEAVREG